MEFTPAATSQKVEKSSLFNSRLFPTLRSAAQRLACVVCVLGSGFFAAADEPQYAESGFRVFKEGTLPNDARLRRLRTLNDKYHPWTPPTTQAEFEEVRQRLREQILVSNGLWPLPEKTPLEPVIHGKLDMGDYTVEKVYFASRPGLYVTGSLYRPKNAQGKIPGILSPHGHWANGRFYDAGDAEAKKQIESGAEKFEAAAHSPLQARMVQLARMGCVVFHYDMVGYADQPGIDHRSGFNDVDAALQLHSKMGLQTWNSIRALDFVASLPDVDPDRIAVTGASGGGTQTFILCALDERPAVSFPAVMVGTAMQGGCNCENADYLRIGINNVAFASAFAPRPMAMSGANDWTIDIETKGLPELKQVYALFDAAQNVEANCFPQFGHNYNAVSRELMYEWFKEHLNLGDVSTTERDFTRLTTEQMTVFDDAHPKPADIMDGATLRAAWTAQSQQQMAALKSPEDVKRVLGPAVQVMLGTGISENSEFEFESSPAESARNNTVIFGSRVVEKAVFGHKGRGIALPSATVSDDNNFELPTKVVLWFDGNGKQALFQGEKLNPEILPLFEKGCQVLSVDLFMTGEFLGAESEYQYKVDESDPCYTFCYNRPLIAERVHDIVTIVRTYAAFNKLDDLGISELHIVGTGEAGVWVALAAAELGDTKYTSLTADLQGFSFASIDNAQHPNLLPGAVKYGDVPGLLRLAAGHRVTLYGANEKLDWKQTDSDFKSAGGQLTFGAGKLTITRVADELLKK
ncbi:MAG: acetylxylan esterase [Planctomycetaceae bacterium]|nr:acetylxylan esterase [Planctomycetaceae bacterium]